MSMPEHEEISFALMKEVKLKFTKTLTHTLSLFLGAL